MKLVARHINKDGTGDVKLMPQSEEDMWHVYNLLAKGDFVTATSFRKVQQTSSTGSSTAQKVKIRLTIEIETIEFDTQTCELRVKGKNTEENEFVKLGQYHSLELALQRNFTLSKPCWDSIYLDRIDMACDLKHSAEIGAVVMQPGLANICLVTTHMTQVRQKIEMAIPRKRVGSTSGHDASLKKFFLAVADAIKRHIDMNLIKVVLVASPGFLKEDFLKWMFAEALKNGDKAILDNKNKFVACQSSSGFKHSLKEVLADPSIASRIENTKAFSEVRVLDNFFEMLNSDPDRAYYGFAHVRAANEAKAIDTLLVTDELFRSSDMKTRRDYVSLVESVKENGGDVKIFSTLHVSGEQLNQLSGVAALLRFPMPEVEMGESKEVDSEDENELYPAAAAPTPAPLHASSSMHQLATQLPASAAAATLAAAPAVDPFKKQPISSSVSLNNLAGARQGPASAASDSSSSSSSSAAKGGIIKGFASEHGM